jgi:hypothetical protein
MQEHPLEYRNTVVSIMCLVMPMPSMMGHPLRCVIKIILLFSPSRHSSMVMGAKIPIPRQWYMHASLGDAISSIAQ